MQLLACGLQGVGNRVVVDLGIVLAHGPEGRRLGRDLVFGKGRQRQVALEVGPGIARDRVVGRVRSGKTDLQKERPPRLGFVLDPPRGHVGDEKVTVRLFRQLPLERAKALLIVVSLAIELALLLDQPPRTQALVPLVEIVASLQVAVLVLDHVALVKAERRLVGEGVHLADVDTIVAALCQLLDPGVAPLVGVLEDAGGMRVVAGKEAGPRWGAGRGGAEAVGKGHALVHQAVEVGRVHVGVTQRADRVIALLVGDDQDDVGAGWGHGASSDHKPVFSENTGLSIPSSQTIPLPSAQHSRRA